MSRDQKRKKPSGSIGSGHGGHGGPMGMGAPVVKAKDFKGSLKRLLHYLKPHRSKLLLVVLLAIASTVFTIVAPKVMSKAVNKLQDGYMSGKVIQEISKGQQTARIEIIKNMTDVQDEMVMSIIDSMDDAQEEAATKIIDNMATAQNKALNEVYFQTNTSKISDGKTYKEKVERTMAFIKLLDKLPETAQNSQDMDAESLGAVKNLLEIPLIKNAKSLEEKKQRTLEVIEVFKSLPEDASSGEENSFDVKSLDNVKALLVLKEFDEIEKQDEKLQALNEMLLLFKDLPEMESDNTTTQEFSAEDIDALREFVSLPIVKEIQSSKEKAETIKKVINLGSKMSSIDNAPSSPDSEVELTDEQIEGVITAIEETNGKIDFNYIGQIVLILVAMYIISSLFSLVMGLVMSGVSQNTVRDLRREVDHKFAKLPLKYFDMHPHGDMLSRVTNDVDTIASTLQQSLTQAITSVISIIGYVVMMLTISKTLTLIVIATLPFYVLATVTIAKKSQKHFAAQQAELGDLSGHVEEMYTGHKIVKVFNYERESVDKFNEVNEKLYEASWKAQFVSGIMFPLLNFVSNIGYVLISIVGGIWITKDLLKIGDMLAFIQYSKSFTMPIVQTANIANVIQSTVACAERIFEVLDEEEEVPDSADSITIENAKGDVILENVSFRYEEDTPLIENLNLQVKEGQTVAIVGPTGAGKTTLVNLLMRFYEIGGGKITVDGMDTTSIRRSSLRRVFGMVLQDTWLFNGTIKENIAYGKENATEEEILEAAKAAHVDHFVRTLSDGYETVLNEEATNISQGQKQLITIARAILADPRILILDEATSSVDTRTEVLIQKAMINLMKGRTSFVIAHRLSTVRDAQTILVMKEGSIIEMGNHEDLLEKHGFYADLYQSQFAQ